MFVLDHALTVARGSANFVVLARNFEHEFNHSFEFLVIGQRQDETKCW